MSMCRVNDSASKGVLDVLKSIYLGFRKVKVQRVTVVHGRIVQNPVLVKTRVSKVNCLFLLNTLYTMNGLYKGRFQAFVVCSEHVCHTL